jgi:hypothetical protein
MLLGFDLAFVWVTVVLGHMSELQGLDDAASLSGKRRVRIRASCVRVPQVSRSLTASCFPPQTSQTTRWSQLTATFPSAYFP